MKRTESLQKSIILNLITAGAFLQLLLISGSSYSQSSGDYRSNSVSSNWSTVAGWETYNGASWVAASEYPGQNAGTGAVTIRDGHTFTITASVPNAIGALTVGEGTSGTLNTNTTANRILTITNDLTIAAGGTYNLTRTTLTVNGSTFISGLMSDNHNSGSSIFVGLVTINSGGSLSTANSSAFTFQGGIDNDGTFNKTGTGAVTFDVNDQEIGGDQPIVMNGTVTINDLILTNNSTDLSLTRTTSPALTGAGTWEQGDGSVLKFSGGSMDCAVDFNTNTNTVDYSRAGTQTVYEVAYSNLNISGSGVKTLGGEITVDGDLTISGTATLASDLYQVIGNASGVFIMGSGTSLTLGNIADATDVLFPTSFTGGNISLNSGSTVIYQNSSTQTVSNTPPTYGNLTIATGGTKTIGGNTTIGGSLTVSAGTFDLGTTATSVSVAGAAAITGTLSFNGTSTKSVTISGDLSGAGTINMSGGSLLHSLTLSGASNSIGTLTTAAVASTITYNATVDQQVFGSDNYRNLVISGNSVKTLQGGITVNNNFTLNTTATFNPAGQNLSVNGSTAIAGTFADGTAAGTTSIEDLNLSSGTIDGAATGVLDVNGNLSLSTGNGAIGRVQLTVFGTTTIATGRTLTFNSNGNTGAKRFDGLITLNGTGTWTSTLITTIANLELRGGITNNNSSSAFSAGGATFSTNNQNLAGAGAFTFGNAVSIAGAITITNQSSNTSGVTFSSTLNGTDVASIWKNDPGTTVYYQPEATTQPMSTGVLDVSASGNYFYYSRGNDQDVKVPLTSYYHLYTSGGGGTATLQGNTTVSGNLNIGTSTTINPGANNLAIAGTTTLDGAFTDNTDGGTNTFTGLVDINGSGSLSCNSTTSNFVFEGGITNDGTFSKTGIGTVSFNTNNQDINGTMAMTMAGPVTISAGRTVTYKNTSAGGITFSNILDGANSSSTWKNDVNSTVYYQPASTTQPMNTGVLDVSASGNSFYYSSTTHAQAVKLPLAAYYNLIINGGGSLIKTLGGNTSVDGSLTIAASTTLDVDNTQNYSLTVKGSFVNSGTFEARSGTVTLNGSSNQTVTTNASTFYNLVITNSATQVSLNDNLAVTNLLTLTDGVVTTGSNRVIISNTAFSSLGGYSSGSFINGNLRRSIGTNTDTYVFPVGNGTSSASYFRADMINNNLEGISYIDSKFKALTGHNDSEMDVSDDWGSGNLVYNTINTAGVWELEPSATPTDGTYDIKLYIANMDGLTDNEFGPLKRPVGSTTGADWSTGGGTLNNHNTPGRTVASGYMQRNGLSDFSEFGGGGGSGSGSGLPIELISFNAQVKNYSVELLWTTATESENDFFTVQRSTDGHFFEDLVRVEGAGNSSTTIEYSAIDAYPYPGTSYYRLRQTDFNGMSEASDIVAVFVEPQPIRFSVIPNSNGNIYISANSVEPVEAAGSVSIVDVTGRLIFSREFNLQGVSAFPVHLPPGFSSGVYLVVIEHLGLVTPHKIILN